MYFFDGEQENELPSETLRHYVRTTHDRYAAKEWKTKSAGAAFLGAAPEPDAEDAIRSIRSTVHTLLYDRGDLLYSMTIDDSSGIYRKDRQDLSKEGILLSGRDGRLEEFALSPDRSRLVYTESYAGQKHLGLMQMASGEGDLITEGMTCDCHPSFEPSGRILFSSCGLAAAEKEEQDTPFAQPAPTAPLRGPAAICSFDPETKQILTLLGDDSHDYLHPARTADGALLCIRRPYKPDRARLSGGCLIDMLLFLPRLVWSFIRFLSTFSQAYSGKSLTGSTDVRSKTRSEEEMLIDGNRIKVEEERRRNARSGEKVPGIIPRTWELVRVLGDQTEVLAKGVCAFLPTEEGIYLSNGSALLLLKDGKADLITRGSGITAISAIGS